MSDDNKHCDYCGELVSRGPWVLLNRYMLGTGTNRAAFQRRGADGYQWETEPPDPVIATGALLHWPDCAFPFIEGEMVEVDFMFRDQ